MRKVVNGRVYDTDTAELICDISPSGYSRSDFKWEDTALYRSPKGQFFLAGEGGALSRWRTPTGQNSWTGGDGLKLVEEDEAKLIAQEHLSVSKYSEIFGEPEEG
jgi:hypothetical protein